MVGSPRMLSLAGWSLGLVTTALVAWSPYLLFAYRSPSLHLVLDSVAGCVALLLTYLLYGRFTRTHALRDLLLAEGLLLLGLAGLGLILLVARIDSSVSSSFGVWSALTLRVSGAGLIAAASLMGDRPVAPGWPVRLVGVPVAVLVAGLTVLWLTRDSLAIAVHETPPASALRPVITGYPLLLVAQGVAALCFFVASVEFTTRAVRQHDELLRWLGPACALAGFARVNYVLFPSLYSGWVYTGDLLRTAAYLVLLIGAAREVRAYWSATAQVAVLEDRRRLARELHDGVVQELAYIRAEASALPGVGARGAIVDACDRALDEARAAVEALGREDDEPLGYLLHRAAQEIAERHGAHVVVKLDDGVDAERSQRHALARITREAVSNAIRHGAAERVQVTLEAGRLGRRLVVRDDGRGFEVNREAAGTGYGMTSMRERALGLPGSFEITSHLGGGTTVVVTW